MLCRTRHTLSDERGFTLSEMLVVTMLVGFVVGTGYFILNASISMRNGMDARAVAAREARVMADRLTLELRQAQEIEDGAGVFAIAEPRRCVFYSDVDRDGVPERVSYRVVDQTVVRSQAKSLTEVPPYQWGPEGSEEVMISNLREGWSGDVFTYYQRQHPATIATEKRFISAVELWVIGSSTIGGRTSDVDLSTWVKVRAVHSEVD